MDGGAGRPAVVRAALRLDARDAATWDGEDTHERNHESWGTGGRSARAGGRRGRRRRARRARRTRRLAPVGQAGRRDPELRAAARVRAGRVLRRGAPARRADGRAARVRADGRRPRATRTSRSSSRRSARRRASRRSSTSATTPPTPERFEPTALKLEDLGVAAYNAQAPNLTKAALAAAARIVSVEARHAAWIRDVRGHDARAATRPSRRSRRARGRTPSRERVRAMSELTLGDIDRDGAIAEALDALHGTHARGVPAPRRARRRGAAGAPPPRPPQAAVSRRDEAILNYALTLEYVQDSFYSEVERIGSLTGRARRAGARRRRARARARRRRCARCSGASAVKRPRFDFRGATEDPERFRKTAVAFEDLAVAAYKGQAPLIQSRALSRPGAGASTPSRRATPRGSGGWPASRPPRTRSTSRARKQSTLAIVADTRFVHDDPQPAQAASSRGEAAAALAASRSRRRSPRRRVAAGLRCSRAGAAIARRARPRRVAAPRRRPAAPRSRSGRRCRSSATGARRRWAPCGARCVATPSPGRRSAPRRRPPRRADAGGARPPSCCRSRAGATPAAACGCASGCRCCPTARPAGCRAPRSAPTGRSTHAACRRPRAPARDAAARRARACCACRSAIGTPGAPTPRGEFVVRNRLTRYQQPVLRADRVRHERAIGDADRLARRRVRRHPRHRPPGPDPRRRVPRLHPAAQRRHPAARAGDAGRDAADDRLAFSHYNRAAHARVVLTHIRIPAGPSEPGLPMFPRGRLHPGRRRAACRLHQQLDRRPSRPARARREDGANAS